MKSPSCVPSNVQWAATRSPSAIIWRTVKRASGNAPRMSRVKPLRSSRTSPVESGGG